MHLVLDGATATPLSSHRIKRFLRHFPRYIGMKRITEPVVVSTEGGLCGIVVIAASHISVHTQGNRVWVDCFSCVGLDVEPTVRGVVQLLCLTQYRFQTVARVMPPARPALASWTAAGALP